MIPNVLSIAGSDPSGGAGIQADLKAISARGCYAMAALTALTAQNTTGVTGVHLVPPDFVADQIAAVFADVRVDAVKIGMIATAEIAEAVSRALTPHRGIPVVLDPVMIAKGGAALLDPNAVEALTRHLLPLATHLTPNLPEGAALLGAAPATTRAEMEAQATALRALGPRTVLLKGGHLPGDQSPDLLVSDHGLRWFEAARIPTANTHGTGCTLSSALAAELAMGASDPEAVRTAKSYVTGAVAKAGDLSVGHGHGPTHHFHAYWPPAATYPERTQG
ncbi:bifunctional hydroxymethylpyrimidine kinase/phosphomethylpyrimidine kinase [Fluviibacterium sp. DFM31]|uniref:hydroxymethylpyrimidine kinase n=1 Tax=Meridianimarinicoccus marinus TaxID=3231483 RepID=A0ABV3L3W3_9RHOB